MVPQSQKRKRRNSSRVNLFISFGFHALIVIALTYFAAREGLLGKTIKKIAIEMVKEKPPEKPKEQPKPKEEPPKVEAPKTAAVEPPKQVAPAPVARAAEQAPPTVAPAAVDVPSFAFEGGKQVDTSSDPVELYKGLIEYSLRSQWARPEDLDDHAFVAEIEVAVDRAGHISQPVWKKSSGNPRWDDSVRKVLASASSMNHAPPTNFPSHITVRFDVVEMEAALP
jgi:outer membrane biosynthesis protein TonB